MVNMSVSDVFSFLSLLISLGTIVLVIYDRIPRLSVNLAYDFSVDIDEDGHCMGPGDHIFYIRINNRSTHRIQINDIRGKWSWYLWLPLGYQSDREIPRYEYHEDENIDNVSINAVNTNFWIEPWEAITIKADANRIMDSFYRKVDVNGPVLCYRVVVGDGMDKKYTSNKILIALGDDNVFLRILKLRIFTRKKNIKKFR